MLGGVSGISTVFHLTVRLEKVASRIARGSHRVISGHRELDRTLEDEDGRRGGGGRGGKPRRIGEGRWGERGQLDYCAAVNVQYAY